MTTEKKMGAFDCDCGKQTRENCECHLINHEDDGLYKLIKRKFDNDKIIEKMDQIINIMKNEIK